MAQILKKIVYIRRSAKTFLWPIARDSSIVKSTRPITSINTDDCYRGLCTTPKCRLPSHSVSPGVFFTPQKLEKGTPPAIQLSEGDGVRLDVDQQHLTVTWEDGDSQIYPFVWLRDNCRCERCFHPKALARLVHPAEFSVQSAEITAGGHSLITRWVDGHESEYPTGWLREYRFDQSPADQLLQPRRHLWKSGQGMTSFNFDDLLESDRALYEWLHKLVTEGIAVVKAAPLEIGQINRLGKRVGFLRRCNYGETFQVKSKADPSNVAYTSGALALHTDLSYYIQEPGVQMLHCIEQTLTEGGESTLSDGLKVATDLKQDDPEAFRLLCTYKFDYYDKGSDSVGEFHQYARHQIIHLDGQGELEAISLSNHGRDAMLRAPVNQVLPLYRALIKFYNMLNAPEYLLQYKMEQGDIMTFNNRRVLHGRNSFQLVQGSSRHLEGSFVEWDEVNSRLRVLANKLAVNRE